MGREAWGGALEAFPFLLAEGVRGGWSPEWVEPRPQGHPRCLHLPQLPALNLPFSAPPPAAAS